MTTSYLTHAAIERHLPRTGNYGHDGPVYLSRGQSIGQRLIPMTRDLTFLWEESTHETLDENKQKVREAGRRAILDWAKSQGEGTDYTDNLPIQRFTSAGPLLRGSQPAAQRAAGRASGAASQPQMADGAQHRHPGRDPRPGRARAGYRRVRRRLSFEVIPRRIDDRGGGLARVAGRLRLLEGLAQPREDTEFALRYYNTLTTWVRIDGLLETLQLTRDDLSQATRRRSRPPIRGLAARVPTYVTIKDVKRRWGHGQEDVFPVAQFEKLWGDLTSLADLPCCFLAVSRQRGQQLKDAAQLDGWVTDGSRDHVESLCAFSS